ncbi:hypothetical protein HS088_TW22G01091 [Tripterygium wilfordii]|uniref:Tify domain-containing protein n=1 Tax=Tripterygium wilfordii TaxID=458696 RepID=A0A7J7BZX0_TRIWF|nr:uncharacterized protein LOC119990477 isoform X2 [Tripterygium wilfordii]KAF5727398.1 hypothetical protein HS088_TW22G01091 [Tripterygium wilfordii]
MNKGFWMAKGDGHITDAGSAFGSSSTIEQKRSHQWFMSAAESELFPNKKQAIKTPNNKSSLEIPGANVASWHSGFQSAPNQLIDRLFGSETTPVNFDEGNVSPVEMTDSRIRRKGINDRFEDLPIDLSISQAIEDSVTCISYGDFRKAKINPIRDSDNGLAAPKENSVNGESSSDISADQAFGRENESDFISMSQANDKGVDNITLMGHLYNREDTHIGSAGSASVKGDENAISIGDTFGVGDANMISFGRFHDEPDFMRVGRPISGYGPSYNHSSGQTSVAPASCEKELDASNVRAVVGAKLVAKPSPGYASKSKPEFKTTKKEAPNSFPSNVRSLISTGMLDGVPVKYVSLSREELCGVIKGSGYLCGCQSCNYSKVLNAYEFERHASSETKHPNNHIYFENGKTIYQIVQELRSTPESLLFNTIQTVFGAPINQKAFRIWKESFQAATRELQRIYGKEEINL